jgi:hypothetical protein
MQAILDQIELQFEELESSATEDEIAAEMAVAKTTTVAAFTRKRPARRLRLSMSLCSTSGPPRSWASTCLPRSSPAPTR